MKYAFIQAHAKDYNIRLLCCVLEVPKSAYYAWLRVPEGARAKRASAMDTLIRQLFYEHRCRYGANRIYRELKAAAISRTRGYVTTNEGDGPGG